MIDMGDPNQKMLADFGVQLFMEIFKKSIEGVTAAGVSVLRKTIEFEKKYDIFNKAHQAYREKMEERYNVMKIIGMSEPRPLRDIFVRVKILEKISAREAKSLKELEEEFATNEKRGFGSSTESMPGIDVVNKKHKLIVLGKPGAGKTTFLKYLALMALDGKLEADKFPIIVGLKEWSDSKKTLHEFIVDQFDICGVPEAGSFVEQMLKEGNCLLLLDGFDEVTFDVVKSVTEIKNFSIKYSKNHFVLSCRTPSWNYVFDHFTDVEMADFNDDQIKEFIKNWFGENNELAEKCWDKLQTEEAVKELAETPLLLTLLCLVFNKRLNFPKNRSELYKVAVSALLVDWNVGKNVTHKQLIESLTPDRKEGLLGHLAKKTFEDNCYFFDDRTIRDNITKYIVNLPGIKEKDLIPDSKDILKSIEAEHGLIVERAKGIYSFSHLTIQEYFTARYIVDDRDENLSSRLIGSHLLENKWREVFLLTAEMLPKADRFFKQIRERMVEIAKEKNLVPFIDRLPSLIKPDYRCPDRIARLCCVVALTGNNDAHHIVSDQLNTSDWNIDDLLFDFPKEKIEIPETLVDYLKATKLLVDCMDTECYLSIDLRDQLLDSVLKEPWEYTEDFVKFTEEIKERKQVKKITGKGIVTIDLNLPEGATPLQMKLIPAGTFIMGEDNRKHEVTISQDFYIGLYQVTQAQWKAVMGENPSHFKGMNKPVECVSWNDCEKFIKEINKKKLGEFRFPTEVEWEYACRAGSKERFYWGDDSNENAIWNYAWYNRNSFSQTHEVGKRRPNDWGLYDISGNVWEWCGDRYGEYSKGHQVDPKGGNSGDTRVLRGGGYSVIASNWRSAYRYSSDPGFRNIYFGFRLTRTP